MNWLHTVAVSGVTSYVVVTLDPKLQMVLNNSGIPSYFAHRELARSEDLCVAPAATLTVSLPHPPLSSSHTLLLLPSHRQYRAPTPRAFC